MRKDDITLEFIHEFFCEVNDDLKEDSPYVREFGLDVVIRLESMIKMIDECKAVVFDQRASLAVEIQKLVTSLDQLLDHDTQDHYEAFNLLLMIFEAYPNMNTKKEFKYGLVLRGLQNAPSVDEMIEGKHLTQYMKKEFTNFLIPEMCFYLAARPKFMSSIIADSNSSRFDDFC